jgi:predicted RNA-binding protein YlxR (DUF448 family)
VGCGAVRAKAALVRLALEDERVVADRRAVRPGRGAYVCGAACYDRARRGRTLARAFRRPVAADPHALESSGT